MYLCPTYGEHAVAMAKSGTYATQLEVQVSMDEFNCNFRIYSSTGSYALLSIKPGHKFFPTYCLAQIENPAHWMAVIGRLPDRVDQECGVLSSKRTRVTHDYSKITSHQ